MKDNICQTQLSAKEQLNNFPSNSALAESQGQPLGHHFGTLLGLRVPVG